MFVTVGEGRLHWENSHCRENPVANAMPQDYHKKAPVANSKVSHGRSTKLQWLPAVPHLVPGAEFCPDAINTLSEMYKLKKRPTLEIAKNARKHLLYLGWKIEYVLDKFRYFSPQGELFYSLHLVCMNLEQTADQESGPEPLILSRSPNDSDKKGDEHVISSEKSEPVSELPNPDSVVIEPECCPEAVKEYCLFDVEYAESGLGSRPKTMKVKKHLSFLGWSFYYKQKKGKRELRYCSPDGKSFYSLLSACKWCVENDRGNQNVCATKKFGNNLSLNRSPLHKAQGNFTLVNDDKLSNVSSKLSMTKPPASWTSIKLDTYPDYSTPVLGPRKRDQGIVTLTHKAPQTILSGLIDNNVVLPSAKVQYRGRKDGRPMAEGRITREGIKCDCCGKVFTLSKFEAHAGSTNHRPSANIFLEDGRSLAECQLQLKKNGSHKRPRSEPQIKGRKCTKTNDYVCSICNYGGELLLCDQCPSSFHTHCIGLKEVPDGDWFCPSCCCGICGCNGFDKRSDQLIDSSVLTCGQCEHQYHVGCLRKKGIFDLYSHPRGLWFCQDSCEQIFHGLRKILGKPIPLGVENFLKYINKDSCDSNVWDNGYMLEAHSKLSVALSLMHECFTPVKVPETGRDLVEDIIFSRWSELNRLNFQGFYTVLLEKDDELISAVTVRIYGKKVAEIPLVATRQQYRLRKMCRTLLNALEQKLMELGVERLVLPSISGMKSAWTSAFGFSEMNASERLSFLGYNFLMFPDTIFCHKILNKIPSSVSSFSTVTQEESCDLVNKHPNTELDKNSAISEVPQSFRTDVTDVPEQESACIENGTNTANGFANYGRSISPWKLLSTPNPK